jgi:hypothetical protein
MEVGARASSVALPEPSLDGREVARWGASRRSWLDNLKVVLIGVIIALHGIAGYVDDDLWPYANVQEVTLAEVTQILLFVLVGPFGFFFMALLFLVAGLLTPGSVARKGPGRFARDRLLRLGVPYAAFLLLWPLMLFALFRVFGHIEGSFWFEFPRLYPESGPLWFVGVLLIFSLVYAGWCRVRPERIARHPAREITTSYLLALSLVVAVASFVVRLAYEYGGPGLLDLNEWQWPECIALFAVGVLASRQGWLTAIPDRLRRQSLVIAALAGLGAALCPVVAAALDLDFEDFGGGWGWPALLFPALEGPLTVFGSVWLLAMAQRHLDRRYRRGPVLARSAYAAYVLQGFVLVGLAVALRWVPVVAEVKALVVGGLGVVLSFGLAWQLLTRIRVLARIL